MQKLLLLITATVISCFQTRAQIIPASGPEIIYPGPETGAVHRTVHTSAYNIIGTIDEVEYELQAWAWNASVAEHPSGIAWRNINTVNGAMTQGYISAPDEGLPKEARDIEIAIYYEGTQAYLIAAYYYEDVLGINSGHYFNTYRWGTGGLTLASVTQISTAAHYGRISIDGFKTYAVAMTWEDEGKIMVKTGYSGSGTMEFSGNIAVMDASNHWAPDIALGHVATRDRLNVRIAYMDEDPGSGFGGRIYVASQDFLALHGTTTGTAYFNPEDLLHVGDYIPNPWYFTGTFSAYTLQLDCPEYSPKGQWSYVFRCCGYIWSRTFNSGSGSIVSSILDFDYPSGTGANAFPTIAYSADGNNIYYGWAMNGYSGAEGPYVAALADINGAPLSHMYVANAGTGFSGTPIMTFAKGTAYTGHLFCAFPMIENTEYYMVTKTKDWSAGSFKPGVTGITEAQANSGTQVIAYPNPFREKFQLLMSQDQGSREYRVTLSDIMGKTIRQINGSVAAINRELNGAAFNLPNGIYLLRVKGENFEENIKVLKH